MTNLLNLIVLISSMLAGIAIFTVMFGRPISDAYSSMYWCAFGAGFIAIKYKVWKVNF